MLNNTVFGNALPVSVISSATKAREKSIIKYGSDATFACHYTIELHPALEDLGARLLFPVPNAAQPLDYNLLAKPVIIGHIGGDSIRTALALSSAARALGRMALWFDMSAYDNTAGAKLIADLHLSNIKNGELAQKSSLFQTLYWEKGHAKKMRSLSQSVINRSISSAFVPLFIDFNKETPFIAAHSFAAHAALNAGMKYVINALPGNCPLGAHLCEGTVHTAQTPYSYLGYKMLRGMSNNPVLQSIPESELVYTGRYVDHLMIQHLDRDCEKRLQRAKNRSALRWLISFDEFSLNKELIKPVLIKLLELEKEKRATVLINYGKHYELWEQLKEEIAELRMWAIEFPCDNYLIVKNFCQELRTKKDIGGINAFGSQDEIMNTYTTDALLRGCDVLISRPSSISLYPVPKLLARRKHREEFWNAMHTGELGEATFECYSVVQILQMIDVLDRDRDLLELMNKCIQKNNTGSLYSGAYDVIRLAVEQNNLF